MEENCALMEKAGAFLALEDTLMKKVSVITGKVRVLAGLEGSTAAAE
jgi:hypothetical protein